MAEGRQLSEDGRWYWNGQQWVAVKRSLEERQAELESNVDEMIDRGFRVTARTDTMVHMMRPKKFSAVFAILWFLVCGFGVLVYIFYWMGKADDVVTLTRAEE